MKKLYSLVLIFFVVCLSLSSCKKDGGAASSIPQELIGKWHQVNKREVTYLNGKPVTSYDPTEHYAETGYVQYFNDGTATYNENGTVQRNFKFVVKNGVLTTLNNNGEPVDGGSKLTVTITTLNLHQDISGNGNEPRTIDLDFVRVD